MKPLTDKRILLYKCVGLAVVGAVLSFLPIIVGSPYIIHLLIMTYIFTVLGMGFSMQFSTGLISLGSAAYYAIGAYSSTLLVMKLGISFWLALPLATVATSIIALGVGSIIVRHAGVAYIIMTLICNMIVVQVAGQSDALGGWGGFTLIPRPDPVGPIEFTTKYPYYYLMLLLMLLVVLVFNAFHTSRVGRAWRAIRLSPALAETMGINLYRYRLLAIVVASSSAGAVGSFYAHYFQTITPDAFGGWTSIFIQLYPVLGGLNFYILGPAIGAAVMIFGPEFLRIAKETEPLITGTVLLLIIIFLPEGIIGTIRQFRKSNLVRMFTGMTAIMAKIFYSLRR